MSIWFFSFYLYTTENILFWFLWKYLPRVCYFSFYGDVLRKMPRFKNSAWNTMLWRKKLHPWNFRLMLSNLQSPPIHPPSKQTFSIAKEAQYTKHSKHLYRQFRVVWVYNTIAIFVEYLIEIWYYVLPMHVPPDHIPQAGHAPRKCFNNIFSYVWKKYFFSFFFSSSAHVLRWKIQ